METYTVENVQATHVIPLPPEGQVEVVATATASYTSTISYLDAWFNAYIEAKTLAIQIATNEANLVAISVEEVAILLPNQPGATGATGPEGYLDENSLTIFSKFNLYSFGQHFGSPNI